MTDHPVKNRKKVTAQHGPLQKQQKKLRPTNHSAGEAMSTKERESGKFTSL